jgi:hypothetical protein
MICGRFPSKNNSRNSSCFGVVFLHENKSRKVPKNTPEVVVSVTIARNRRLWVTIILGPVSSPRAWEGVVDSFLGLVESVWC